MAMLERALRGDGRRWSNWAGTVTSRPGRVASPASEAELAEELGRAAREGQVVRAVGSGHSFNDSACSDGVQLHLERFDRLIRVDPAAGTIRVGAGMRLRTLVRKLDEAGLALASLGDIDHQTVAGAIATGTHGTGVTHGPLSSQLRSLRLMTPAGDAVTCSREEQPDLFAAARTGVGSVGIVTEATFEVLPSYSLRQRTEALGLDQAEAGFEELTAAHDHVYFMFDFASGGLLVRTIDRVEGGARTRSRLRAFVDDILVDNFALAAAAQFARRRPDRFGAALARFPRSSRNDFVDTSHRVFVTPRLNKIVSSEYSVPIEETFAVLRSLRERVRAGGLLAGSLLMVRFVAPDDSYLGMSNGRLSALICPVVVRPIDHRPYFEAAANVFTAAAARPHWGKWHRMGVRDLAPLYPDWEKFQAVRATVDPEGRLSNAYTDRVLGPVRVGVRP